MLKPEVVVYISGAAVVAAVPTWVQDIGVYTSVFAGVVGALLIVGRHLRKLFQFLEREVINEARESIAPELNKMTEAIAGLTDRIERLETLELLRGRPTD